MERTIETHDDLIDLGAASVETKGDERGHDDMSGLIPDGGLTD